MLEVVEAELVPGLVVAGKWRLECIIGKGGFGVVWSAVDVVTGEPRALKCLTEEGALDTRRQERLRREARAMSSIAHPNIARVFSVEELPAGTPFIVMELLRGITLHARLGRGALSVAQGCGILIQIADALRTVHARGIIHRDLKPANVMIVDESTVKVLDFGIAKDVTGADRHKLTTTGTALGTLYYMAPEQIFGERNLDPRCDLWALGVIAHECLTLRRPSDAEGDNSGQVLKKILDGNFPRLSSMVPGCPADLDDLVARMLSRKVAERPTSEEVFATLSRPANTPTTPRSLGKTNFMEATIPLSDSPNAAFGRTVRDPAFAASQLVPSTVVPSTVIASGAPTFVATAPPGTVVPSTVVPSTVMPSTVLAGRPAYARQPAPAATLASAVPTPDVVPVVAPAITPMRARPSGEPTFDRRARPASPSSRLVAIALAVVAGIAVIGIGVFAVASARMRRTESAAPVATVSSAPVQAAQPAPTATPSAADSAAPSSSPVASAAKPAAASSTPRRAPAPSGRIAAPARASAGNDAPPPITDERF